MNARMIVAAHKRADVPSDSFYLPVHVGHALNPTDLGYQRDDEGDNISELNASYCELTALYWAWKNLDADHVGLSHYRRYFVGEQRGPNDKGILSGLEADRLMIDFDVVLSKPRNYYIETIDSHYRNGHHGEDLDVLRDALVRLSPEYVRSFDLVFGGRKLSLYNMFFMRKELFNAYADWLFEILGSCEPHIDNAARSQYQQRTFGYLGERLLNVWVQGNGGLRAAVRPVVNTAGEPKVSKAIQMMRRKLSPAI